MISTNIQCLKNYDVSSTQTFGNGLLIRGTVKKIGASIPCRVRLYEKLSGKMVDEVSTDQDGGYKFNHLVATKFFIVAHDPVSQYNAVIQDNVVPK